MNTSLKPETIMSIITGALKWDLFVVYIIMCVIFISLCCCSITFMFLCCPAKKENVKNNTYSPMTPFPTAGLGLGVALRTAEIAAVNRSANSHCASNGELPGEVHRNETSIKIENSSSKKKRNRKIARFAEQKSNSIDVPSFPSIGENKPLSSNHNGNKISSKAIVEPMPSDMIERCGSKKEHNLKNHQKGSEGTASVGTMTPTQLSIFNEKKSKSCNKKTNCKKTKNISEESTSSKNCSGDVSNENTITGTNKSKSAEKDVINSTANDLHLFNKQSLGEFSKSPNGTSKEVKNCANGPTIQKNTPSITGSKSKRRKKSQRTLQPNSFKHSVKGNNILFEFTDSTPLGNFELKNENPRNGSTTLLKSKCNELLSQPKDQKGNIESTNEENKLGAKEMDTKNMSYRQGLFVIYVDETYVDL